MHKHHSSSHALQADFEHVAQQQQSLLSMIFPSQNSHRGNKDINSFDARGIAIYRNNLVATAQQALAISYPTVLTFIGDGLFNYACRKLLIMSPPKHGDWALWGEDFPSLLSEITQLSSYPFVGDLAKLDWLIQQTLRAKDSVVEQSSLQLLATHNIDKLFIELSPSMLCMTSRYPVMELYLSKEVNMPIAESQKATQQTISPQYLESAIEKLSESNLSQNVLIYRSDLKPEIRELSASEHYWLHLIRQGVSIGEALDLMSDDSYKDDFDFAQWFGLALKQNLITHLREE